MSNITKKKKLIVTIIISVVAALLIGCGLFVWLKLSKMYESLGIDSDTIVSDDYELDTETGSLPEITITDDDITFAPADKPSGTIDIILLGTDNRDNSFSGRTDTLIFMRVDMNKSKIKMVSLMRDTLVKMKGHSRNKLNTAFRFGKMDLLKSTLEDNFGLSPSYYIVVNFYGMEDIIDALGGVEMDIQRNELSSINSSIKEVNGIDKTGKAPYIEEAGLQNLSGRQAVAYMRVRKSAGNDGDAARIERQQAVLVAMFDKAENINLGQIPGLINSFAQYIRTDIPISELLRIANIISELNVENLETYRFPENYYCGSYEKLSSVVISRNLKEDIAKLNDFLDK